MIIECENCGARYQVSPAEIGTNGRFVRCSSCGYEWLTSCNQQTTPQAPAMADAEPLKVGLLKNSRKISLDQQLDRQPPYHQRSGWFYGALLMALSSTTLLVATVSANGLLANPWFLPLQQSDLKISDLQPHIKKVAENRYEMKIDLQIANTDTQPHVLESVRITCFGHNLEPISELVIQQHQPLQPNQSQVVHNPAYHLPLHTRYLGIEIGNPGGFMLRQAHSLAIGIR